MISECFQDLPAGLTSAVSTQKPLLIFFCSPSCFFCQQMDNSIFSHSHIIDRLGKDLLLIRVTTKSPEYFRSYNINATPAFLILGPNSSEYARFTGNLDKQGLMAFCLLGLAKWHYDMGQANSARNCIEELTSLYPQSLYAPEGLFLRGIYRFRTTNDRSHLRNSYETLAGQYPDSPWVKRARLLYLYPCAFFKWEAYRNKGWETWEGRKAVGGLP